MTDTNNIPYKIITQNEEGYYEEKKSKFISYLSYVESEEEALSFLSAIKKKHYDAKHNCFAMIIGADSSLTRSSDDKEPHGTAGMPILEVLKGAGLTNVICVVTRYFGGTLLGTGGLVRAYSEAARDAVSKATIATITYTADISITVDYSLVNSIQYYLNNNSIKLIDTVYSENVSFIVRVAHESASDTVKEFTELCNGRGSIEIVGEGYFPL